MSGPIVKINKYKDLSVTRCGAPIPGLVSASYSFRRSFNSIFQKGSSVPVATYGVAPEIDLSYTSFNGSFSVAEANVFSQFHINGTSGSVGVDFALLSSFSFDMSVDSYLKVTKTFSGFSKPSGGGGSSSAPGQPLVIKRQDFGGNIPSLLSGNHLQKISGQVSISRQFIPEFASRKPYASVVQFPISASITYEFFTDSMDGLSVSVLQNACQNPESTEDNVGVSACSFSFNLTKAYVTSIEYNGGDANSSGGFQTMSVTYTSYENLPGLNPIVYFRDDDSSC